MKEDPVLMDRFKGALLGLAVGDALGVPAEFQPKGSFPPVKDMVGGGPFNLPPGYWTDDTSLALCTAQSLIVRKGLDLDHLMSLFYKWRTEGYMSSTGKFFDVGGTTAVAIRRWHLLGNISGGTNVKDNGNGSIMRLAPVPMGYFSHAAKVAEKSALASSVTHAHRISLDACRLFGTQLWAALRGIDKSYVLNPRPLPRGSKFWIPFEELLNLNPEMDAIKIGNYCDAYEHTVEKWATGYVVDTLRLALWAFANTYTFEDGMLLVVNQGGDADTAGAVYGQLAGAYYGMSGIPDRWLDALYQREFIEETAKNLQLLAMLLGEK